MGFQVGRVLLLIASSLGLLISACVKLRGGQVGAVAPEFYFGFVGVVSGICLGLTLI